MRDEHKPAHKPGAQGHEDDLLRAIAKLEAEHSSMMGNQHNPDYEERTQNKDLTSRLYEGEQSPKDYKSRKITGHRQGNNFSPKNPEPERRRRNRYGDNGGTEY